MFGFIKNIFKKPAIVIGDIWVFKKKSNPLAPVRFYRIVDMKTDKTSSWGTAIRVEETMSKKCYDFEKSFFLDCMEPLMKDIPWNNY